MLKLTKKPKSPTIIVGFPGFGLVGTISTEFLSDHLGVEVIGKAWFEEVPATIAIHESKVVNPVTVFYCKKYNIVIIHSITAVQGLEWKAADLVLDVAKQTAAKEILVLEGVGSASKEKETETTEHRVFCFAQKAAKEKLVKLGVEELKESIIMGITSALILKSEIDVNVIFAQVHSNLPDSKAAAKMIEILDKYLGLKVDNKPLLKMAEKFEEKIKKIITDSGEMSKQQQQKQLDYMG